MAIYAFLAPFSVDLLVPVIIGFVLCFYGGNFYTLIAAAEAYQMVGYESSLRALNAVREMLCIVYEKEREDAERDQEKGVDLSKVDKKEYFMRKANIAAQAINVEQMNDAMQSLASGFFAVVATCKQQFCLAVTLGKSIGGMLERPANKIILPIMRMYITNPFFEHYGEQMLKYAVNAMAMSMAFWFQTYVSTVQAAMRGGLMVSRGMMGYVVAMGWYNIDPDDTIVDEIVGYSLAAYGAYSQFYYQFNIPFPLNVLFWPASLAQNLLIWSMGINR